MKFVNLKSVITEIDNYKREALESLVDIKVHNEVDCMFKKCFEEIVKSIIDLNFDRLKYRIDSHVPHYESIDSLTEKLEISMDKLKNAIEEGEIKSKIIINLEQFNRKIDLLNSLKAKGNE